MTTIEKLKPLFGKPGLSTKRAIDEYEVRRCMKLVRKAKKRVRVYSGSGFVARNYKWGCAIQYVEAVKNTETGKWVYSVGWTSAQRPRGMGGLEVVQ